jgi:hypothetical protein
MTSNGAVRRPRPPGAAAAPPPISDHEFEPWRYESGLVVCMYFDPQHPTRGICDRPEDEHAPAEDAETVVAEDDGRSAC